MPLVDIEAAFMRSPLIAPDPAHSDREQRFIAIGRNAGGRAMFIAFTLRLSGGARLIRPISARYMHEKEIRRYEERPQDDN